MAATGTSETRELVQRFFEVMNTGNDTLIREFMLRHFADDIEWQVMGTGVPGAGIMRGRDTVLSTISGIRTLFEPGYPRGTIQRLAAEGPLAAVEAEASGPMRDGRHYHNRYCFFFQVREGRIQVLHEYFDTHYVHELLG